MKSKKKQNIACGLFLLVLFFIGNYYLANLSNNKVNHENNSYTLTNEDNLRTSGHWNLSPFVIDDFGGGNYTWEEASAETWCSGSGTLEDPYLIENVTIDGGNSGNCIAINNSDKFFRIENCTVFNSGSGGFDAGIQLDHVGNGTLINNNCSFNNRYGIYLLYSDNTTISGNTANNNSFNGISLSHSNNNTVSGNTLDNNSFIGIYIFYSDNNNISENTVNNNEIGIYIDYSYNTTVSGNTADKNNYEGILFDHSANTTVSGNTVNNNNWSGIFLGYSGNTTVSGNTANNNGRGIYLYDSDNTTVSGNTANNNQDYGIYLIHSDNTTVSGNTANNNSLNGLSLYHSNSTTVSGNTANNNVNYGIVVSSESDYNLIYKNYFNDNNINAYDNGTDSKWDNGVIGNYWDDYLGYDNDFDGIGDTPYLIAGTGGGQDKYPIWTFQSPIHIDDSATGVGAHNWTWAETQPWCSGSGNFSDPYIIDGLNITARGVGNGIMIEKSYKYFIVQNCKLIESGSSTYDSGILLDHAGNGTIINNNCSFNNAYGINLYYSDNTTVSGNTANNNNDDGILHYYSDNTTVSGNTANNNSYYGIYLYYSDKNTVSGNTANYNTYDGIYLYDSDNTTVTQNTANNNTKNGIDLYDSNNTTVSGNTANNNKFYGIRLWDSNNNTLSGNTANNNSFSGILLDSDNNIVSGNTANNNTKNGIHLYDSNNTTISGNTANYNSFEGINLYISDNNNILGNTANYNQEIGIWIYGSLNTTISGNTANYNRLSGINIRYSDNTTVSGNTANNNQDSGIYLYHSNSTTISGNFVDNNVNYGIIVSSESGYTLIYKNYFNDNSMNAFDNGKDNKWDNGVIGNYWDDYAGVDANDDGIGDTPYIILGTAGSQDNFPIWDDGDPITPVITIILPSANSVFGLEAPNYQITIVELNLDTIWYTLDGGGTNYTITNLTGTFNQLAWGALSEDSLTIRFYASDTAGNIGSAAVTVKKDISAPVITIILPLTDSVFDLVAPYYNISIDELNLDTIWYTLDGGITNYTITDLTGTFNHLAWEALSEGSLTIKFYASDTAGNIGSVDVEVIIEIPEDLDDLPIISFGNYYLLFTFITILSFIILEKRKKK